MVLSIYQTKKDEILGGGKFQINNVYYNVSRDVNKNKKMWEKDLNSTRHKDSHFFF